MRQNNYNMISEWIPNVGTRRPRKRLAKAIQRVLSRIGEGTGTDTVQVPPLVYQMRRL